MNRWNLAWLLGIPAFVLVGMTLSFSAPVSREHEQDYELIRLIAEVLQEVDQNYVRELTPEQRRRFVEDMINGGLEHLDPHSTYFNAQEFTQFNNRSHGKFGGIGIQVAIERAGGGLLVSSPIVGTPAYEAGIQPGDIIVKVDGQSLDGKRSSDIIELIQGEPGTPVTLTILHDGDSKTVDITVNRAVIEVSTVIGDHRRTDDPGKWDFMLDKENKLGYVRVLDFYEPTAGELQAALDRLAEQGAQGLILDLRGNPGGLLDSAVKVADQFLAEGEIVDIRGRLARQEREFDAKTSGTYWEPAGGKPIIVLVDRFSASASEIVSAALQDHHRAIIVGERSFGKGSVQNVIRLAGEPKTALKLTTASYWRPSGKNIHRFPDAKDTDEWGVKPNEGFEVKLTDDERRAWLMARRARDIAPGKTGMVPEKLREALEKPFVDKVLDRALAHLREATAKRS